MTLESQVGRGSLFHLYLPLTDVAGQTAVPQENAEPVLLLISNSDSPTAAITTLCQRQQLSLYRLKFGDDISAVLKKFRPAGLAWDVANAHHREWELFEQFRAYPQLAQLPLIVYGQDQNRHKALGMTDVLLKPISDKTLIGTLTALYPRTEQRLILIVDDDPDARALYARLAGQALPSRAVEGGENGAAALSLMERETPGLVILDLMMPEIDGFTVLERIRANIKTRHIPVMIMSGHMLTSDDVRRLDYGNVIFQSQNILGEDELVGSLRQTLHDAKSLSQPTSKLVKQALAYLHQNYVEASLSRQELAAAIGTSKQHLDRIFGKEMQLSVIDYLNRLRIEHAKQRLIATADDITMIATEVGYNDSAYFSRVFRKLVGTSPSDYRKRAS